MERAMSKKVYTYQVKCDFEVSFEAEDESDAADSLHTFLDHQGLDNDYIDVTLQDEVETQEFDGEYFDESGKTVKA